MSGAAGSSRDGKKPAESPATPPLNPKPEGEDPSPPLSDKGDNRPPAPPPTSNHGEDGCTRRNNNTGRPPLRDSREKQSIPQMGKKLEGPNFTAWAKSLKMLMYMYPVECHYRYNVWHIVEGALMHDLEEFADIGLDEEEWYEANYFALLTIKRNSEEEPHSLIELCDYTFETYEILQTHYEN